MSNVLQRFKSISSMEFFANMRVIQGLFMTLLMGKHTPKKYRHTYAEPVLQIIEEMLDDMQELNGINIYKNPEKLDYKREKQLKLIKSCDKLYRRLQSLMDTVWYQKLHTDGVGKDRLEAMIEKLSYKIEFEVVLLEGWRRSTVIRKGED